MDFDSWEGDEGEEEESITGILKNTSLSRELFDEIRGWWFLSTNTYQESLAQSAGQFAKKHYGHDHAEAVEGQFSSDIFMADLLDELNQRFFDETWQLEQASEFRSSNFIYINEVDEDEVWEILSQWLQTDEPDSVSEKFFESQEAQEILLKVSPGQDSAAGSSAPADNTEDLIVARFCDQCGSAFGAEARFCSNCGNRR